MASARVLPKINLPSPGHWRLLRWIPMSGMPSPCSPAHRDDQPAALTSLREYDRSPHLPASF